MKWIFIGAADQGKLFKKELDKMNQEVVGVYSKNYEETKKYCSELGIKNTYKSMGEALTSSFDAAYVVTPTGYHYQYAKELIQNKKHVFIEKSMTADFEQVKELFKLGKEYGVKVMEGLVPFTRPELKNIKAKKVKADLMDPVISWNTHDGTPEKDISIYVPSNHSDAIYDIGCYTIGVAVVLLGKIKSYELSEVNMKYGTVIEFKINSIHEDGGIFESKLSLLEDGDNTLFVDDKVLNDSVHFTTSDDRLEYEVKDFIEGNRLDYYEEISTEVSRVLSLIRKELYKN